MAFTVSTLNQHFKVGMSKRNHVQDGYCAKHLTYTHQEKINKKTELTFDLERALSGCCSCSHTYKDHGHIIHV